MSSLRTNPSLRVLPWCCSPRCWRMHWFDRSAVNRSSSSRRAATAAEEANVHARLLPPPAPPAAAAPAPCATVAAVRRATRPAPIVAPVRQPKPARSRHPRSALRGRPGGGKKEAARPLPSPAIEPEPGAATACRGRTGGDRGQRPRCWRAALAERPATAVVGPLRLPDTNSEIRNRHRHDHGRLDALRRRAIPAAHDDRVALGMTVLELESQGSCASSAWPPSARSRSGAARRAKARQRKRRETDGRRRTFTSAKAHERPARRRRPGPGLFPDSN